MATPFVAGGGLVCDRSRLTILLVLRCFGEVSFRFSALLADELRMAASFPRSAAPTNLYPTPAAHTVGRLQFGTARYMTDRAKICPRPGAQNNVASDDRYAH